MKIFTQVLGLTLITNIYAFDFQDGFKKLSESLERNKKSVDIAQYLEPKESYKDDKGNTFLKYIHQMALDCTVRDKLKATSQG